MDPETRQLRERLLGALAEAGGNRKRAAEILGIGRATLYRWIDRCGLDRDGLAAVAGRYDLLRPLASRGGSETFLARDRAGRLDRLAVRLAPAGAWGDPTPEALARIRGQYLAVRHPGLCRVFDLGLCETTGRPFVAFEWREGRPPEPARHAPEAALRALRRALQALDALHRRGLAHGGIDRDSLLVPEDDPQSPFLGPPDPGPLMPDFPGVAEPGPTAAPELRRGGRPTARSDLYALGALIRAGFALDAAAPGDPLAAFVARLMSPDPARRPPDAGAALEELETIAGPAGGAPDAAALLAALEIEGRDEEIALAVERLDPRRKPSADARPALVIVGEPGIGRSRFLEACAARLRAAGVRVASAACHPGGGLAPLAEILRTIFRKPPAGRIGDREAILARYRRALAAVLPDLATSAGGAGGDAPGDAPAEGGAPLSRFQLLDGVASALADAADLAPLVVAIDDLHLADPLLLDLFWHLARVARRAPLRLIATSLPPGSAAGPAAGLAAMLDGSAAEGLTGLVPLGPLTREAVHRIAEQVLGPARTAAVRERLWELSRGQPSFVLELLRELLERGREAPLERITLPGSARELMRARLERLDPAERRALEALVVAERPATAEELARVTGEPEAADLAGLLRRGLVRAADGARFLPAHELLKEILLDELPEEEERRWHLRWAAQLERDEAARAERARHLVAAGAGPEIRDELVATADALAASWQPRAAIPLLEAALDRCAAGSRDAIEICRKLEVAARDAVDRETAARACERWAETARRLGDRESEARALSLLAAAFRVLCRWDDALDAARRAVALAEASGSASEISIANKTLALTLWMSWHHRAAIAPLRTAMELARTGRNRMGQGYTLNDVALPLALIGRVQEGLDASDEARRIFEEVGRDLWYWLSLANRSLIFSAIGALDKTIETQERLVEELRRIKPELSLDAVFENLAFALLRAGRYSEALDIAQSMLDEATRLGRHSYRVTALLLIGEALHRIGDERAAREHDRLALKLAQAIDAGAQLLFARLAAARDLRAAGRLDAAAEAAREVFEQAGPRRARKQAVGAALELARIAHAREAFREAQRWLDEAESALEERWEESAAWQAQVMLERARCWDRMGERAFVRPQLEIGLALARHHGPAETHLALAAALAEFLAREGEDEGSLRALEEASAAIDAVAERLSPDGHRASFLNRPDIARLRETARRRGVGRRRGAGGGAELLEPLARFAREAVRGGPPRATLEAAAQVAAQLSGAGRAAVLLRAGESWRAAAAHGFAPGEDPLAAAPREILERLAAAPAPDGGDGGDADLGLFPVRAGAELLGAIHVDSGDGGLGIPERRGLGLLADQLGLALARARLEGELAEEARALEEAAPERARFGALIGRSEPMQRVFALLEKVAPTDVPVLIHGESGTGKELAARALHDRSPRASAPFLSENCAAIPASLLESALFGHVKGAFTGADADKKGLFELAEGGTLLLDEIGDMSVDLQAKLLRVLQEREIRPVGSERTIAVNVRVIAATHRDLARLVNEGQFRQDLFFRLNGITVELPPLRERKEDIPLLLRHFLALECEARSLPVPDVDPIVLRALARHDWPGNVRELQNTVRRLLLLAEGDRIGRREMDSDPELRRLLDAPPPRPAPPSPSDAAGPTGPGGPTDETDRIRRALAATGGNRVQAAALLGISRATLYRRMARLGLNETGTA